MSAVEGFSLPRDELEAMLDARLEELVPAEGFDLAAFEAHADGSEGARLRLSTRICGGGDGGSEPAKASAPAGMTLGLIRMLAALPWRAGSAPTLFPVDIARRHGAAMGDFDARRASDEVVAACGEARALAREKLSEAERLLAASPQSILPAFIPLGAVGLDLDRLDRNAAKPLRPAGRGLAAPPPMGDLALGAAALKATLAPIERRDFLDQRLATCVGPASRLGRESRGSHPGTQGLDVKGHYEAWVFGSASAAIFEGGWAGGTTQADRIATCAINAGEPAGAPLVWPAEPNH